MNSTKIYLITYDLSKDGQAYAALYSEIQLLCEPCHCLESVWIVKTTMSALELGVKLKKHIDHNDKLFVIRLASHYYALGIEALDVKWLEENLSNQEQE